MISGGEISCSVTNYIAETGFCKSSVDVKILELLVPGSTFSYATSES
jgi:hypothetical protein